MTGTPLINGGHSDGLPCDDRTADQRRQDRVRAMEQLMQAAWAFADPAPTDSTPPDQDAAPGQ